MPTDTVEDAAATVAVVGAVSGGKHKNPMDKYKKRLKRMKIAAVVLFLLFIVLMAIGIALLVLFVPKWSQYKPVAIAGIVFVALGLLILFGLIIAILILCKLYNSLTGGTSYHPPKDLTGVKYPRQADYEVHNQGFGEGGGHPAGLS